MERPHKGTSIEKLMRTSLRNSKVKKQESYIRILMLPECIFGVVAVFVITLISIDTKQVLLEDHTVQESRTRTNVTSREATNT